LTLKMGHLWRGCVDMMLIMSCSGPVMYLTQTVCILQLLPHLLCSVFYVIFRNSAVFLGYESKLQCIWCNICWNVLGTSGWFYRRLEILWIVMEPECWS
jgi:hypothetical protein